MESEKVKEIKKALKYLIDKGLVMGENTMVANIKLADILTLINEVESENERLKKDCADIANHYQEMGKFYFEETEKTNQLKDRIALLEKDNELLRNAKVVYENVDYCYEDLNKAEKRIAELEKHIERVESERIRIKQDRDKKDELASKFIDSYNDSLKQFATLLKVKTVLTPSGWCVNIEDIDETLKEFIKE